jgi:polyketide biosynthesis acyl carrier protein
MTREAVFQVVRSHLLDVLRGLAPGEVSMDDRMSDLGANSIDRMDVVVATQQELGVDVEPQRLAGVRDIRSLVEILHAAVLEGTCQSNGQPAAR